MSDLPGQTAHTGAAPALSIRKLAIIAAALLAATIAVAVASGMVGVTDLTWYSWKLRMVRAVIAATVGAGLAAAGMALQGMLRNPLAEPYILGISSGAGVGVLAGLILAPLAGLQDWVTTPATAFVGALLTCLIVYGAAQRRGRVDPYVLLLSGVIVNVLNGAVILAILLFLKTNDLINFVAWGMGRVPDWLWYQPGLILICSGCVVVGWAVLFLRGASFNMLALGDEVAGSSGLSVHWLRVETFFVVSLMTAAAVALAGPIGFLGLVVPHVCRLIVGADHRRLVIVSGFAGAIFLIIADTFCRSAGEWIGTGEIPLGIITALTGGPFFIYLLRRRFQEATS